MDALDAARALLSSGHSQDHRSFNPGEDRENGVIVGLPRLAPGELMPVPVAASPFSATGTDRGA